jgi:membrane protease YdiL (CAAX protease family)
MPPPQRSVQVLGGVQSLGLKILAVAAVGLAAPVAEEILFRGVVFRGLRWRMTGTSAYVLSAIFFSLAHLDPDHFLHLFGIGLVLAWTVDRSHSLYPGMILHGAINLTSLWTLW